MRRSLWLLSKQSNVYKQTSASGVAQVEDLMPSEHASLWREYVAAFGDLLVPASQDPGFPAAQRLVCARQPRADYCICEHLLCCSRHTSWPKLSGHAEA